MLGNIFKLTQIGEIINYNSTFALLLLGYSKLDFCDVFTASPL